ALRLLDVVGPLGVPVDGIDGNADDFYVAPIELGFDLGHVAELGGANGREVLGMREQHRPGIPNPIVELDGASGGLRLKIRRCVSDAKCHRRSPLLQAPHLAATRVLAIDSYTFLPSALNPNPPF